MHQFTERLITASASGALDFSTGFSVCMFPVPFIVQDPLPHAKAMRKRTCLNREQPVWYGD